MNLSSTNTQEIPSGSWIRGIWLVDGCLFPCCRPPWRVLDLPAWGAWNWGLSPPGWVFVRMSSKRPGGDITWVGRWLTSWCVVVVFRGAICVVVVVVKVVVKVVVVAVVVVVVVAVVAVVVDVGWCQKIRMFNMISIYFLTPEFQFHSLTTPQLRSHPQIHRPTQLQPWSCSCSCSSSHVVQVHVNILLKQLYTVMVPY